MLTKNKRSRKIMKNQKKWKYVPITYNLSDIKGKRSAKPYKFKVQDLWSLFTHHNIAELLHEKPLDIIVSTTNSFTGNTIFQETMTYQEFSNYKGPLTLYLAQIQLDLPCPKQLNDSGNVFLWCSKGFTDSGWHYDSYENYLGVVEGTKIVYLRNKCINWSQFESVCSEQYNHLKKGQKLLSKFVILQKNEMLYIPQGMLHRVISYDSTIGVNVWMESITQSKLKVNHYQLRYILNEIITKDVKKFIIEQARLRLKTIHIDQYKEDILNSFSNFSNMHSLHRNQKQKPLNQLIGIYICILANMPHKYMIQFMLIIEEIDSLTIFQKLPYTYQAIIALKLDEFSESIEQIEFREKIYALLQIHGNLIESLQASKNKLKYQIAQQIISNHFRI
ncbi:unnamed protein product [Paramecium pentaurelia]|uniref:JmjC domain-containing protein n=1 Tax=Paramecium pentaurelia TaxID=43138 RepID=A0A8S1STY7_9CILI|nr:unnamed protein product [Paramecium pentaurelia]